MCFKPIAYLQSYFVMNFIHYHFFLVVFYLWFWFLEKSANGELVCLID